MKTVYTPKILEAMQAVEVWNYATAVAFAAVHNLKPKSVVSKVISLGMPYEATPKPEAKEPVEKVVTKAELVAQIELATGLSMPTLINANLADLVTFVTWFNVTAE